MYCEQFKNNLCCKKANEKYQSVKKLNFEALNLWISKNRVDIRVQRVELPQKMYSAIFLGDLEAEKTTIFQARSFLNARTRFLGRAKRAALSPPTPPPSASERVTHSRATIQSTITATVRTWNTPNYFFI